MNIHIGMEHPIMQLHTLECNTFIWFHMWSFKTFHSYGSFKITNLQYSSIINFLDEIFSTISFAPNHNGTINIGLWKIHIRVSSIPSLSFNKNREERFFEYTIKRAPLQRIRIFFRYMYYKFLSLGNFQVICILMICIFSKNASLSKLQIR